MTPPKVLLCNYTPAEEKAWRFLLRGFPMLQVISVSPERFGWTLSQVAEGHVQGKAAEPGPMQGRLVVFAGEQGELLKKLIDLSNQVTKEHAFRAILTESNRNWTLNYLYAQLEQEEQSLLRKGKR